MGTNRAPPPFHPRSVETLINIAVNFGIRGRIIVPEVTFRISYDHRLEKPHVHVSKCGQTPVANEPFIALPNPLFDFFRFFFEGSISIDTGNFPSLPEYINIGGRLPKREGPLHICAQTD